MFVLLLTHGYPVALFPTLLLAYFAILMFIGWRTSGKSDNDTFFRGNRNSPWYLVAFGMIGASLSGVTFLSIPGTVGPQGMSYMQMVLGYFLGYLVISHVLLPLYYKLNLTSIYTYLQDRLGGNAYKTGALYFLLSRSIGSALRLYLVAVVMQVFISTPLGISFTTTVLITLVLIWLYSFRGGIKTLVYTDTLQTFFMLTALALSLYFIAKQFKIEEAQSLFHAVQKSDFSRWWVWNPKAPDYFWKHFLGGMFITIVMTGLDQDMMQKNLTCRNVHESRKNMYWMSSLLIPVNFLFLLLGAFLYLFGESNGYITPVLSAFSEPSILFHDLSGSSEIIKTDQLFPYMAAYYLPPIAGVCFFIGLVAAAYSTADSALTSLTTSFCVDFLGFGPQKGSKRIRRAVHLGFTAFLFLIILIFSELNSQAVINELFKIAGYTYGPLLGMFSFGIITRYNVKNRWVPWVCIAAPILSFILDLNSQSWFWGYKFGFELLILNGLITFAGLILIQTTKTKYYVNRRR